MKKILILFVCLLGILTSYSQSMSFKSDANTERKPWTNLKFKNDPDNFQFVILSDRNGGSRPGVFEDAIQKINLMQPEFVLSVGDLIAGYSTDTAQINKQWNEVNASISKLEMPFFYLPGNHDIGNKIMEKEWEKRYGSRYYSFNYKNTLFIILDSNDDDDFNLTRKQTDFVLNTLKENQDVRWTFVLMHHPIWNDNYNTDGRFQEIEAALKNRKYTVIAGHEHHYHQAERNGSNYYILSTTGAGSSLRGTYFGEFDHIAWMTMTNSGPVMANLRLDGILPHDVSNEKTEALAQPLIENARLNHVLLCNKGPKFTNGTLYLSFKNPTQEKLSIDINFYHHHQLQIKTPSVQLTAEPGSEQCIEIPVSSAKPLDYQMIDLLILDWQIKYNLPEYKGFGLEGRQQLEVNPSQTNFIEKEIDLFTGKTTIPFKHQFSKLDAYVSINQSADQKYSDPVEIGQTSALSFYLKNNKDEYTAPESRTFVKTVFREPTKVAHPKEGLNYNYFEGEWTEMPDFNKLKAKSGGVASDFIVTSLAKRKNDWGLVYTGFIKVETDNFYLFQIKADNTCRFYIDGQLIVDDMKQKKNDQIGAIGLKKGFHSVRIEFLEKQGDARLRYYSKAEGEEDLKNPVFGPFFH